MSSPTDRANRDRLQPCLLDRLTDDRPTERSESRDSSMMSLSAYRSSVLRDLETLLNTPERFNARKERDFPEAATSVLNYGAPDLSGRTVSGISPEELRKRLTESVRRFEPRVLRGSLSLDVRQSVAGSSQNGFEITITGELWAQPAPEPVNLRSRLDLDTGRYTLENAGG